MDLLRGVTALSLAFLMRAHDFSILREVISTLFKNAGNSRTMEAVMKYKSYEI